MPLLAPCRHFNRHHVRQANARSQLLQPGASATVPPNWDTHDWNPKELRIRIHEGRRSKNLDWSDGAFRIDNGDSAGTGASLPALTQLLL